MDTQNEWIYYITLVIFNYYMTLDSLPLHGAFFGSGLGPIFLDNVVCRGTESSLLECRTNPISQHNCDHSEDAGVRCNGITSCMFVINDACMYDAGSVIIGNYFLYYSSHLY